MDIILMHPTNEKQRKLLDLLDRIDSWSNRMKRDPSVTQSIIAKEEGISRSRVAQLLELAGLSTLEKVRIESDSGRSHQQAETRKAKKLLRLYQHIDVAKLEALQPLRREYRGLRRQRSEKHAK